VSGCARQWPPSGDASGAIAPPDANPVVPSGAIVALRGPDRLVEGWAGTRDGQGRTRRQRGIGRRERGQKGDAARRLRGRAGEPPLAGRPLNSRCFSLTKPGFAAQPAERAWPCAELGLAWLAAGVGDIRIDAAIGSGSGGASRGEIKTILPANQNSCYCVWVKDFEAEPARQTRRPEPGGDVPRRRAAMEQRRMALRTTWSRRPENRLGRRFWPGASASKSACRGGPRGRRIPFVRSAIRLRSIAIVAGTLRAPRERGPLGASERLPFARTPLKSHEISKK
jgi:hypothetical protein